MIEIAKLKNGITVITEPSGHYNSAAFGVWVRTGSKNETKENNGISHFIEHMLFKGTSKRNTNDISRETSFLGGNVNAYTSKENTSYYARTLPEYLTRAIDLIGDMISGSLIDEEEMEREKSVVCEEIDMYKDSPDDYVHEMLQKHIWNSHPLGYYISGKKKTVKGFTRQEILDYMNNYYTGENMIISVAGKINRQEAMEAIEKSFGGIRKKGRKTSTCEPGYNKVYIVKKRDIEQVHLNIAFRGASLKSSDRYGYTLLNAIFGSDVNSRLFREIREKNGLTYSVYSYGSSFENAGLFHIYGAMNPEQLNKVYSIMESLIYDLVKEGVTEAELNEAKHQLTVEMTLNRDNVMTKMTGNAKSYMNYGEIIPFRRTIKSLNNVTTEDIKRITDKYIVMEEMSVGLVGPIEKHIKL